MLGLIYTCINLLQTHAHAYRLNIELTLGRIVRNHAGFDVHIRVQLHMHKRKRKHKHNTLHDIYTYRLNIEQITLGGIVRNHTGVDVQLSLEDQLELEVANERCL